MGILLLAACRVPDPSAEAQPADGRLAFVVITGYANSDIFAVNADGTGRQQLTETPQFEFFPVWSPDGRSVAFSGRDGIYLIDVDGSNLRRLTDRQGATAPTWSPDGKQLAFSRWSFEQPTYGLPRSDIYLLQADGSQQNVLVATSSDDTEPAWSPDGTRIAFVSAGAPQPPPAMAPPSGATPPASTTPTATPKIAPEPTGTLAGVSSGYPVPAYPRAGAPQPEPYRPNDIFIITLADGSILNVTHGPEHESSPAWHP